MKILRRFILCILFILATIFIIILLYALIKPIAIPNNTIHIYDKDQALIYQSSNSSDLLLSQCPSFIKEAIVQVEDKRFYSHLGFDPLRITKSLYTNIKNQSIIEGGSTITQQYAKNLFLSNHQSIDRKLYELLYSIQIEMQYSKEEILEGYMNSIYYGHGIYGFKNAASFYFDKELKDLSISEIALLIGIPNGPSYYSPILNMENATNKRNQILSLLYKDSLISKQEYKKAIKEEIQLDDKDFKKEGEMNYYVDAVLSELHEKHYEGDLSVYTYYDPNAQQALNKAVEKANTNPDLQTSGIIMQPYTGNIIALLGGNNYTISSYNRSLYAKRQIASTIKPLLYYAALTQGFTPSSTFSSEKTTFALEDGTTYSPSNYNNYYPNKEISMIHAISTSDNIYAMKTHLFLGIDTLKDALSAFGIESETNPSLALGTVNLSISQLAYIYNTFASEGYLIEPAFIHTIQKDHKTIYQRKIQPKQLLDRDTTLILNQLLTSTYDNNNIDGTYPTLYGKATKNTTAVKSGTSLWDLWAIGYNPYYTVGIWNGYDDNRELLKEEYETSKEIWRQCFNTLMKDKVEVWYEPSKHMQVKTVNPINGKEENKGSEYWYLK